MRRRTERNGVDFRTLIQQLPERFEVSDAIAIDVGIDNGDQLNPRRVQNGRQMMAVGDLAETGNG